MGRLAGFIMAHRGSNIERIHWAVDLLKLKPDDVILEIGCGPGIAIQRMSEFLTGGVVYGIDHSQLMISQATKRNGEIIASGKAKLMVASASALPAFDKPLDKILDINSFQFWDGKVERLVDLRGKMARGGMIAIVHQPRKPGAKDLDADEEGRRFQTMLVEAGFERTRIEKRVMKPVATICAIGYNT